MAINVISLITIKIDIDVVHVPMFAKSAQNPYILRGEK